MPPRAANQRYALRRRLKVGYRALVGAGDILNRLMQERHINWNDLCDHIQARYPAVWEKHREEERRMLAWAEACRYGGDAAQWETFHQALQAVLALRIYWIGLYAVDHEAETKRKSK